VGRSRASGAEPGSSAAGLQPGQEQRRQVRTAPGDLLCGPAQAAQEPPPDLSSIHLSGQWHVARVQLFLSTVSAEFLSYRERLRHLLTRPDVEVKAQEDFIVTGDETLEMLDHYIQSCDGVIHLVADMTGAMARPPVLVEFEQ
jgi:hypothetical protein